MISMPRRRGPAAALGVALAVAVVLSAGCGSDDTATTTTTPTSTTPATTTQPATTAAPTTSGPTTTTGEDGSATSLTDADRAAIEAAFTTFFGGADTTVDEKVAVLEDGERYRSMLEDAAENEQFQQLTTDVHDVTDATPAQCAAADAAPPCALVTHDLLVGGFPMAVGIESPAVSVGGEWLVGAAAWCGVVEIGGESCP